MAKILFSHSVFPMQFARIATFIAKLGHECLFIAPEAGSNMRLPGVQFLQHQAFDYDSMKLFCERLRDRGFVPDVVYAASWCGDFPAFKEVFPRARLVGYFRWPSGEYNLLDLSVCDRAVSPTEFQKTMFHSNKIEVVHEGIDTKYFAPVDERWKDEDIITYTTRGMEPLRCFSEFMESMEYVLGRMPQAHVVIAGEDKCFYGGSRIDGKGWGEHMMETLSLPRDRVHFVGTLPYERYRDLLRKSTVHMYLTKPYVLSWSLLEAMSCGCLVVSNAVPPVKEVIVNGKNGILINTWPNLSLHILDALANKASSKMLAIRQQARQTIEKKFELKKCLGKLEEILMS